MFTIQDVIAAIAVVFDALTQAIYAMSFGFLMVPTAIAYVIGIAGMLAYGSFLPISMQAETIALTGTMGKNLKERLSIILYAGIIMVALGAMGALQALVDFAGDSVIYGMMAGVGIILTKIAIDFVRSAKLVGGISIVVALAVYFLSGNLVYAIVASVVAASAVFIYRNKGPQEVEQQKYKFAIHKPTINPNIIRATLAVTCLTIGANIAFGNITASMAGAEANIDGLTVYSGIANVGSALFGGAPIEAIISPTAAAPNPMFAGILMMAIMAVLLVTGMVPKIARFVPVQAIAGCLFVIGAVLTIPVNTFFAFYGAEAAEVLGGGMAIAITALADPFLGLVAGIAMRIIAQVLGLGFY